MTEEEDFFSKTVFAAPRLARGPAGVPKARLICSDGATLKGKNGAEILLDAEEVTIGRGEENVSVVKADGVSRKHARVFFNDHFWHIEDSGSTNGIRVNGKTVKKAILKDGDVIEIGPVPYTFNVDALPDVKSEKTLMKFAIGIPGFDPNRLPGGSESSVGSKSLLWSIVVIGVSALAFAVFTIISI